MPNEFDDTAKLPTLPQVIALSHREGQWALTATEPLPWSTSSRTRRSAEAITSKEQREGNSQGYELLETLYTSPVFQRFISTQYGIEFGLTEAHLLHHTALIKLLDAVGHAMAKALSWEENNYTLLIDTVINEHIQQRARRGSVPEQPDGEGH